VADLITLTEDPVRVVATGSGYTQDLRLAVDVSAYDELDLVLSVFEASASVAVKVTTGMQRDAELGWVDVGTFASTGASAAAKANFKNLLRYVRYVVTTATVTTSFTIHGIGRRWE
jgi:hypothetical protein